MRVILIILTTLLPAVSCFCLGINSTIEFVHHNELHNIPVYSIVQGKSGYIWIGTKSGLYKYDSRDYVLYKHNETDSTSIPSNPIYSLFVDSQKQLWIGTGNGLCKYNEKDDNFIQIKHPQNKDAFNIRSINEDTNGNLWVGTLKEGFFSLAAGELQLNQNLEKELKKNDIDRINTITTYHYPSFILGTNNGLYIFNPLKLSVSKVDSPVSLHVRSVTKDKNNRWFVGTENHGLLSFEPKVGIVPLNHQNFATGIEDISTVRSLFVDDNNQLWIGCRDGLYLYTPSDDVASTSLTQINSKSVRDIFRDKNGDLWIGYFFKGMDFYHQRSGNFNFIQSPKSSAVNTIIEDDQLNIWMGSLNSGISIYNQDFEPIKPEIANYINSIAGKRIMSLLYRNGTILIGTENSGLFVYDIKTNSVRNLPYENSIYKGTYKVAKDPRGGFWVSYYGLGINYIDEDNKQVVKYRTNVDFSDSYFHRLNENHIHDIVIDNDSVVWLGTVKGLYLKKQEARNFQLIDNKDLASLNISYLHISGNNTLWIGTLGEGVFQYNLKTKEIIKHDTSNGLCNNYISALQSDHKGDMWISTYKGLSKINKKTRKISNYYAFNELKDDEFRAGCFLTSRGKIIMGALSGIVYFDPDKIKITEQYMPVLIQDVKSYSSQNSSPISVLRQYKDNKDRITLNNNQSFLSVDFIALNYLSQSNTSYAYKIEDVNDWIYLKNQNSIFLSNLNSGEYTFRIKASNSNGNWAEKEASINIKILPPYYKTTFAYTLYLIILIGVIFLIFKIASNKSKKHLTFENEQREKERIKEVNEFRTRFFTNISHEFRTPLTLIIEPARLLKQELIDSPKLKQNIDIVFENANRLLNLTNQILDFRKTESNKVELKLSKVDIVEMIHRLAGYFDNIAASKSIDYSIDIPVENYYTQIDTDKVEKILNNLLSNAFKYTPKNGWVRLSFSKIESPKEMIQISISNSGKEIPKDQLSTIFTRFTQLNDDDHSSTLGTGIGLALTKELISIHLGKIKVESSAEKGNCFTFHIPAPKLNAEEVKELNDRTQSNKNESKMKVPMDEVEVYSNKPFIIIVEDNKDLQQFLRNSLSDNYEIETADDGLAGVIKAKKHLPDLVISDVMMPHKNGFELCKELKTDILTSHIPIVLLTAKTDRSDKIAGFDLGTDDYIEKPFDINVLKHRIDNIIRTRQSLRSTYTKNILIGQKDYLTNEKDEEFINIVTSIVERNISNQDLSISMLCDETGFNQSSLYKKIKSLTNLSIIDFIRSVRLRSSIELLEDEKYNVSEVAYLVGFNDPKYFSKCFKNQFGQTPSEHIKSNRQIS